MLQATSVMICSFKTCHTWIFNYLYFKKYTRPMVNCLIYSTYVLIAEQLEDQVKCERKEPFWCFLTLHLVLWVVTELQVPLVVFCLCKLKRVASAFLSQTPFQLWAASAYTGICWGISLARGWMWGVSMKQRVYLKAEGAWPPSIICKQSETSFFL